MVDSVASVREMRHGMNRGELAGAALRRELAGRRLVWFGIRGDDASSLTRFGELSHSLTVTSALAAPLAGESVALEQLSRRRPDLDRYELDEDLSEPADEFRDRLATSVDHPSVLVSYRSSLATTALALSRPAQVRLAGPVVQRQRAFEYKPWVETSLRNRGIPGIEWRYLPEARRDEAHRAVADGPQVLRRGRGAGGVGILRVDTPAAVDEFWSGGDRGDPLTAIAPFVEGTPVNFSGCVFADGSVRLHPASVQLVGLAACTDRPLGYCGNDFGALADAVEPRALQSLNSLGVAVGRWLHEERYIGVFGVDALVVGGEALFVELNPRFQGSSAPTAAIAAELGEADLFVDHIAAALDLPPAAPGLSIGEWAAAQQPLSKVVVHNTLETSVLPDPLWERPQPPGCRLTQIATTAVEPGAALACLMVDASVTRTGFDLDAPVEALAAAVRQGFSEEPVEDRDSHSHA